MAVKAKLKQTYTLSFWVYDLEGFNSGARHRFEMLGELKEHDNGSFSVTVKRQQRVELEEFYLLTTNNGVTGSTKKKPEPKPEPCAPSRRQKPSRSAAPNSSRGGSHEPLSDDEILEGLGITREVVERRRSAVNTFFDNASIGCLTVGLHLKRKFGPGIFIQLVELGLYGEAFWLFYKGECFKNEALDPADRVFQLLDMGAATKLAPKYVEEASS